MKIKLAICALLILITFGCAEMEAAYEIMDIFLGDPAGTIHSGVVSRAEYDSDSTRITFEDGNSFILPANVCCPRVGETGSVVKTNDELDFE